MATTYKFNSRDMFGGAAVFGSLELNISKNHGTFSIPRSQFKPVFTGDGQISGKITWEQTPAENFKVEAYETLTHNLAGSTFTDAQGQYVFDLIDERFTYDIIAYDLNSQWEKKVSSRRVPGVPPRYRETEVEFIIGQPKDIQLTKFGGSGSYITSLEGTLPEGLSLVNDTIVGTWPTGEPGTYDFKINLIDNQYDYYHPMKVKMTLLPLELRTDKEIPEFFEPNVEIDPITFYGYGGSGEYSLSITKGSLPSQVHFVEGTLAGIMPHGEVDFTIRLDDTRGDYIERQINQFSDLYWLNTIALLNFEEGIGNESDTQIQIGSNLIIRNDTSKFGNKCLEIGNAPSTYIDILSGQYGSGDFTIEFWHKKEAQPTRSSTVVDNRLATGTYEGFLLTFPAGNISGIGFYIGSSSSSWDVAITPLDTMDLGQWHHISVVRSGQRIILFLNGSIVGEGLLSENQNISGSEKTRFGTDVNGTASVSAIGLFDDFRITKGVARYTDNFTPPTKPFPNF